MSYTFARNPIVFVEIPKKKFYLREISYAYNASDLPLDVIIVLHFLFLCNIHALRIDGIHGRIEPPQGKHLWRTLTQWFINA